MHFRTEILWRWWIVILLQGWWFGFGVAFASPGSVMLSVDSPLATSGDKLFAVAADGHTLVSRSIGKSKHWSAVRNAPALKSIGGLVSDSENLFISDPDAGVVHKLPLSGGAPSPISIGKDINQPGELATSAGFLFVADRTIATVVSINLGETEPTARLVFEGKSDNSPISLATDADELLVASGKGDLLFRLNITGKPNRPEVTLIQGDITSIKLIGAEKQPEITQESRVRSVYRDSPTGEYPPIPQPVKLSALNGLVYVIGAEGKLYVTPKVFPRAVEIPPDKAVRRPVSLLATDERLFVLDGETGNLTDRPRPLAAEFVVEQRSSECSAFLYDYLNSTQLLPVREVSFEQSFEKTLKDEKILVGAYPKSLDGVICALNPKQCKGKGRSATPKNTIQPGEKIRVPVLFGETKLAYRRTALASEESVGEVVDQAVIAEQFADKKTPKLLCELNPTFAKKSDNCSEIIRQQRGGNWVLPQEILRYVVAVPAVDFDGSQLRGGLRELKRQCPSMLINPLERRPARQQDTCPAPVVSDWKTVDQLYRQATREVIHYPQAPVPGADQTVQVAVAESSIDYTHPDFRNYGGHTPFLLENSMPPPNGIAQPHGCGFRMVSVSNDIEGEEKIKEFQSEFESKKKECAVLIVNSSSDPDKFTIAGFSDEEEFKRLLIVDPRSDLSVELKKGPTNEGKIVELVASNLGRTPPYPFAIRPFDKFDKEVHGTAVAYLIAGQRRHGFVDGMAGLAPRALLVPLTTELNVIHSAFANSPYTKDQKTKIVNLSLTTADGGDDAGLRQLLEDNPLTLFVAAAGNTLEPENTKNRSLHCAGSGSILPACQGMAKNVLVVAATSLDGTRILETPLNANDEPCEEGSIYDAKGTYVHVAAPGAGFYAAGRGGTYVPLRGTSFSAPLVTATAALLMGQGVTNPDAIKRRIIATSEPFRDKSEAQKVLGGLLHVENAVRWPHEATIILDGQVPLRARLELSQNMPPVKFSTPEGKEKSIDLDKVLRMKRLSSGDFWVVFVVSDDEPDQDVRVRRLSIPSGVGFTFQPLNNQGEPFGDKVTKNLDELKDFIAPVYE